MTARRTLSSVYGVAPDQETKEKIVLCCGNVAGVEHVDDRNERRSKRGASEFYTVKSGDHALEDRQGILWRRQSVHEDLRGQPPDAEKIRTRSIRARRFESLPPDSDWEDSRTRGKAGKSRRTLGACHGLMESSINTQGAL
jgi:hypothetical protein